MFCVSGYSGVGKDEFCKTLVANGAIHTGLADPAKRHMADVYGFTEEQLFGPSKFRNAGDLRYPKDPKWNLVNVDGENWTCDGEPVKSGDPKIWLSPREALQKYCEVMNTMFPDTWIRKGVEIHRQIADHSCKYSRMGGVKISETTNNGSNKYGNHIFTCFSDFRHKNEIRYVSSLPKEKIRAVKIRIKSKRVPNPPFDHRSETEQATIPDDAFDYVIDNDGTVEDLSKSCDDMIKDVLHRYGSETNT